MKVTDISKIKIESEVNHLFQTIVDYNETAEKQASFCIGPSHQIQATSSVELFEYWVNIVKKWNYKR